MHSGALTEATLARIGQSFAGWPRAVEVRHFVTEVMRQRARAVHSLAEDTDAAEEAALTWVLRLVEDGVGGAARQERAVAELAADVATLSAFFQHLDLLPPERDAHVDAIAMMVAAAVHRLSENHDRPPDTV